MAKVISLVEKLRERSNKITYEQGKFPIFEGQVIRVAAEEIQNGESLSVVDYLPTGTEFPKPDLADLLTEQSREEYRARATEVIQRVLIPFSVNPTIVNRANVKGYIREIEGHPVYTLEVLMDESISDVTEALSVMAGQRLGSKYGGFQYMVPLRD